MEVLAQNFESFVPEIKVQIQKNKYSNAYYDSSQGNDNQYLKFKQRKNPFNSILGGLMYLYQNLITQQNASNCNYLLSCSNYSKQSIGRYGVLKGVFLSADRLMRCNKYCVSEIPPYYVDYNNKAKDDPIKYKKIEK